MARLKADVPDCVVYRFPRFVRLRDDKKPEEATGPEEIRCDTVLFP